MAVGAAGYLLLEPVIPGAGASAISISAAALGALLPDVDHPSSMLSRKMTPVMPGVRIGRLISGALLVAAAVFASLDPVLIGLGLFMILLTFCPHRGVTHSIVGLAVAGVLAWVFGPEVFYPVLIGYSSHLVADLITGGGIPLLWPWKQNFSISMGRSGGIVDRVTCLVALLYLSIRTVGLLGFNLN